MAVLTVVVCDRCGKKGGCSSVTANVRHSTDAAGSRDTEQVAADLCGGCAAAELTLLLTDNVPAGRQWWTGFQKRRAANVT